ncbi:hypothetical protein QTP88_016995 [Uroleucon formosanum]
MFLRADDIEKQSFFSGAESMCNNQKRKKKKNSSSNSTINCNETNSNEVIEEIVYNESLENFEEVIKALRDISTNPIFGNGVANAESILKPFDLEFVYFLFIWDKILNQLFRVNKKLQSLNISIDQASKKINSLNVLPQEIRDTGNEQIKTETSTICDKKTKVSKQYSTNEESSRLICFDQSPIRPTRIRFIVITIMSITFLIQTFSQSIWSAIYEPALLAFPDWTSRSLSLLPVWGNVMTAVLVLPVCIMVDKYGLKVILSCSCCFFTLGTAVRCMPIMYSCTLCLHLSAVCLSVGSVVTTPLIVTMSAQWFPKDERNIASGVCSAVSMLGSAATYIIGPMMVSAVSDGPSSRFVIRIQIMHMMYTCLGLNAFVTLMVCLLFPRHTIRGETIRSTESDQSTFKLVRSLKTLVMNLKMWCLVLALTLSNTMSVPWWALIPSTFSKIHVSSVNSAVDDDSFPFLRFTCNNEITSQCCFFMIVHTFGLSLTISSFAHRAPHYTKALITISRCVSLIFLLWLMLMMNFNAKLTTIRLFCAVLVAFPYNFCTQSLLYEMGVEFMCPLPGSFVAGYMTVLNNLFVDVIYVVLYFFPSFGKTVIN